MSLDSEPLFTPVPRDELPYCVEIAPIERLMIRIDAHGNIVIKGQRAEIEALLQALHDRGVTGKLNYLSFCG